MTFELDREDLEALALGGCFFGSGGGGTLESARHLVSNFQKGPHYPADRVRVVSATQATEGEAVMVAYLGAPEAIDQVQMPQGPVQAVQRVQARLAAHGRKLAYVVPPESGALGFVVACLVAAKLGLAVIDGDGAGRAVPSLPMLTYAAAEVDPRPAFLVSEQGLCVELDVSPRAGGDGGAGHQNDVAAILEHMLRPIVSEASFGQFGGLAMWVMAPPTLQRALPIRGTLSRALKLGRALREGRIATAEAMVDFLAREFDLQARVLFDHGRLKSGTSTTAGGFDQGQVLIEGPGASCTVVSQNESLLAWSSVQPQPLATAPDSIAFFLPGTADKVASNGDLLLASGALRPEVQGQAVTLLGLAADKALLTPGGLILDSFASLMAGLGYLGPYVPLAATPAAAAGHGAVA